MNSSITKSRFRLQSAAFGATLLIVLALSACRSNSTPLAVTGPAKKAPPQVAPAAPTPAEETTPTEEPTPPAEAAKPEVAAEAPAAESNAEGVVALVDDTATQLLRERLSPPKEADVVAPAGSQGPSGRPAGAVELLTGSLFKLPGADVPSLPGLLPSERLKTPFAHPALDLPPLAFARDPARPETPKLPLGPRAFVASPDVNRTPHIERFARDAEPPVLPTDDPSAATTRGEVTSALALPVPVLAPPQLLSIPDPFENARAVELKNPPPDADPPVVSQLRPTRPVLTPPPPPKP